MTTLLTRGRVTIHVLEPATRRTLALWTRSTPLTPPAIPTWADLWRTQA